MHDHKVLNGSHALAIEMSKVKQYAQLSRYVIVTPKTVAAVGRDQIVARPA